MGTIEMPQIEMIEQLNWSFEVMIVRLNKDESCETYNCIDISFKAGNPAEEQTLI